MDWQADEEYWEESGSNAQIDALVEKYGGDAFDSGVKRYLELIEQIGSLNRRLASQGGKGEKEYNELVQQIIATTQIYYGFIGDQPEDMRAFYLVLSGGEGGPDTLGLEKMKAKYGFELPFSRSPLLSAQAIRPKNYIMQIDAITNQLAFLDHGSTNQLRVGTSSNQPVRTTVTLDMPDHMRIEGGAKLTTYDKSIINGVTSLLESGNTVFSIPMLYHAMTGRQNPTVDEGLYEEIAGKLDAMRRMMLTIDLSEEADAHYLVDESGKDRLLEQLELEGYLLPLNKVSGVINGKKTELYQIIQHPPLYSYSKLRRQLASVELSLLGAPVNNNSTTIPLKTYLLQRIEMMKNKRNSITQHNILYESIYQELGVTDASKTKKMRIRGYTTTILRYFVDQGYIRNYVEYKNGRSIAGVSILLS